MKRGKKILKFMGWCGVLFLIFNIGLYLYCYITPRIEINKNQSYYLYDSDGNLIFDDNEDWISLDKISPYLIEATINTEDKYFYKHLGFDYLRILKAVLKNVQSGSLKEGASTITQQYARNLFLNYDKTWSRKIDEAMLAAELEAHYTKEEILEGYLNTINYGGVYGIENASWYYFGHSASELTLAEASMLAGIPQSPSNYSPLVHEDRAKSRQKTVLTSMVNNGVITAEEMNNAYQYELSYIGKSNQSELENVLYFRDAVLSELENIPTIPNSILSTGGLKIYTTLDVEAQEALENAVKNNMEDTNELQVAGMMMDPNDGGVLAMIGGTDYSKSQFNRAINAKRQVGSTMKPILYYSALENGFTSASCFTSEKTTFNFSNNQTYTPNNYNDTYANGLITMGAAISYSDNIYAVKTHLFLGEKNLINTSKRLGIESNMKALPSLALGTAEISMIEMVESYSTFANTGYKVESHFIERVEDNEGNVLYEYKDYGELVLNQSLTFILNEMLTYTYDSAFIGYNYPTVISLLPKISNKYAIKTGTTDTDVWIIGYNKNAVLSIWNGYDDNQKIASNDNGYHKNIWIDTMEEYLKDKDNSWYELPENVVGTLVNPITGELAKDGDKNTKIFYFLKGTEPSTETKDFEAVFKEENEQKVAG
ncbi:MAG: PBP1A family penicillin-binding protein [Bacilli bacterium]|nr:PBP1A family penicillin-binding protein [Bacilli bacterium]